MPEPRHRAPRRRGPAYLASAAVAAAGAISTAIIMPGGGASAQQPVRLPLDKGADEHVLPVTLARVPAVYHAGPVSYRIRPGDTLSGIASRLCGNPADFRALAVNNGIRYADRINAGQVIKAACHAAAAALSRVQLDPPAPPPAPVLDAAAEPAQAQAQAQPARPAVTVSGGTLGCAGLEQLWDAAGGNPNDAFMAAEIAMAESGGNQYALSPTDDYGYWQINASNGALATFSALGNARSAILLSGDGTNWSPWTTYTSGLYAGRC